MAAPEDDDAPSSPLERLRRQLREAVAMVDTLDGDDLAHRALAALRALPPDDLPVIVDVLEREAQARRLSRATQEMTGQSMHPNPHARLYLRSHANEPTRADLEIGEMASAMLRGMQASMILTVPAIRTEWEEATRRAVAQLPAAMRPVVDELLAAVRAILAAAPARDR